MTDIDLEAVFRREAGACTATLIRVLGDIDLAEDSVAEAFAIAAEKWPVDGVPVNPGGWIMTTARRRAIDRLRREATRTDRYVAALQIENTEPMTSDPDLADLDALVDVVADDQLRLLFLCCHPALHPNAQTALTLRLLAGLTVPEIARAFLVTAETMNKRIGRAKRKLRDNHASYRIPESRELPERLHVALTTIYLVFAEGHTATESDSLTRTDLTTEAIRLGRVISGLMPDEPETHGLLALMLLTEARRPARTYADGSMIRLSNQDRSEWDRELILEGHELVRRCLRLGHPGRFQIQAAIAAVHADASSYPRTDWGQIVALYDQLLEHQPTAVVRLNRAIAVAELDGPAQALKLLEELSNPLDGYQPFHAARADLLARSSRFADAVAAYDTAINLTSNQAERDFLAAQRLAAFDHPS